jgi:hypothetical protein
MTTTPTHSTLTAPVPAWPGVTVTVSAAPAKCGPVGTVAAISRRGAPPDQARQAIRSGAVRYWTLGMTVRRYSAAHALTQSAGVHADMTVCEIAAAILAVFDQATDPRSNQAAVTVADTMARCADLGVETTPDERRAYRQHWPDPARTRLCQALADRLLAYAAHPATGREFVRVGA